MVLFITPKKQADKLGAPPYDTALSSIGGVASTALFDDLNRLLPKSSPNQFPPGSSLWKHSLYPPLDKEISRGVFVLGPPEEAVISIIRRGATRLHLQNKGLPGVAENWGLEDFLNFGRDVFRTAEHLRNWKSDPTPYPILFLDISVVLDGLPMVEDFLHLKRGAISNDFVLKDRKSDHFLEALPAPSRARFREIMGDASDEYQSMRGNWVKAPSAKHPG